MSWAQGYAKPKPRHPHWSEPYPDYQPCERVSQCCDAEEAEGKENVCNKCQSNTGFVCMVHNDFMWDAPEMECLAERPRRE